MIARTSRNTIPIVQIKPDLNDAVRMAAAEITWFLSMFYSSASIKQTEADKAIAGQWLSRIKGFRDDDDFLHPTRDLLAFVLSSGARSHVSDYIGYHFLGFMPSYGAAHIFVVVVAEGATWTDVRAFMHSQAYGDTREHAGSFDRDAERKASQNEINEWAKILLTQDDSLQVAKVDAPALLAQAARQPNMPIIDVLANDPYFPKLRPPLRGIPGDAAAEAAGVSEGLKLLLSRVLTVSVVVRSCLLLLVDTPQTPHQRDDYQKFREEMATRNPSRAVAGALEITQLESGRRSESPVARPDPSVLH
jgi:hypothetical protein